MTTTAVDLTTPTVPVELIHAHDHNVRWNATADDELIASVQAVGIAQALTVMPNLAGCDVHAECFTLAAGHRRLDAAHQAGLAEVPVMLREDLVTESQQLEFMLVENLHRSDLTPVEEAAAYEQLQLFGHDVAAIAAATGRSQATVKSRMKLVGLPESARDLLHAGDATLADAEALLDFADDPAATSVLEAALGTPNFRSAVQQQRYRRERAMRHQIWIKEFTAAGIEKIDHGPGDYWDRRGGHYPLAWFRDEALTGPAGHDGCLGYHYAGPDQHADPILVCRDGSRHEIQEGPDQAERDAARAQRESEWEAQRAEREAAAERRAAAAIVRGEWIRDHFVGLLPVKSHGGLATAATAFLPLVLTDADASTSSLAAVLGLDDATEDAVAAYAADVPTFRPTKVLRGFASWLTTVVTDQLDTDPVWLNTATEALQLLALWDWLKAAGYPMSDIDVEVRTALEVRHTELTTEESA